MINTAKVTDRRELHFATLREVLDDVERLDASNSLRATGNWTPAQTVQHVAKLIELSIDGFPVPKAPLPIRIVGRLMRTRALNKTMPPGFKFPRKFTFLVPDREITWDEAVKFLRHVVARAQREPMTQPSPVLGRLTPLQWEQLQCRHAEMHLSFLHPE